MTVEAPHTPEEVWLYLSDPVQGLNKTPVFFRLWTTPEVADADDALRHLKIRSARDGLRLRRVRREPGLTVLAETTDGARITFGRSLPTNDEAHDLQEIVKVLKANGLAVVITD